MRKLSAAAWFAFGVVATCCTSLYLDVAGGSVSRWSDQFGLLVAPVFAALASAFLAGLYLLRLSFSRSPADCPSHFVSLGLGAAYPVLFALLADAGFRIAGPIAGGVIAGLLCLGLPIALGEIALRLARTVRRPLVDDTRGLR